MNMISPVGNGRSLEPLQWDDAKFNSFKIRALGNAAKIFAALLALKVMESDATYQDSPANMAAGISAAAFTFLSLAGYFYYKNSIPRDLFERDVVLVLQAEHDEEDAFEISAATRKLFKRLEDDGYQVTVFKVSRIQEVDKIIKSTARLSRKIKALWLRGHGSPTSITLGRGSRKDSEINVHNLFCLRSSLDLLDKEASIILDSCSTGKKNRKKREIALEFAKYAPNRTIYAPTMDITGEPKINQTRPLVVKFYLNENSKMDVTKVRCISNVK